MKRIGPTGPSIHAIHTLSIHVSSDLNKLPTLPNLSSTIVIPSKAQPPPGPLTHLFPFQFGDLRLSLHDLPVDGADLSQQLILGGAQWRLVQPVGRQSRRDRLCLRVVRFLRDGGRVASVALSEAPCGLYDSYGARDEPRLVAS